jgi:hypothetical protein
MNTAEQKSKRGRPPVPAELKAATIALVHSITKASGLTPAALEDVFGMSSTPPGNNWRRYLRGERTLSAEMRERIGLKAAKNGWLRLNESGLISLVEENAYRFIASGGLKEWRAREQANLSKERELSKRVSACVELIGALREALQSLDEIQWTVRHFDPELPSYERQQRLIDGMSEMCAALTGVAFNLDPTRRKLP